MRLLKHIMYQPFIFATGLAALVHSTWSLGTLFTGPEPMQFTAAWFAWLLPALLIAFSLDIGQIVTSAEIRAGERTFAKYLTFLVFAVATYYLQWLYIVHHNPVLALAAGIREEWKPFAELLRDAAVWFIPALLPLSTTLYTFSHRERVHTTPTAPVRPVHMPVHREPNPARASLPEPLSPRLPEPTRALVPVDERVDERPVPTDERPVPTEEPREPVSGNAVEAWFNDPVNAEAVRRFRAGELSQQRLADLIGVSRPTVSRYVAKNEVKA